MTDDAHVDPDATPPMGVPGVVTATVRGDAASDAGAAAPAPTATTPTSTDTGTVTGNWYTRRRLAKWDGSRRLRGWRRVVSISGRVLIATGLLMFGFVAYQLWGTGLETARAQRALESEFDDLLAAASTTTAPPTTTTAPTTTIAEPDEPDPDPEPDPEPEPEPPGVDQAFGPIEIGDPLARLEIPRIDGDHIVVAGVGVAELQRGPGHFPETPIPGQLGNAALAGHRTTYGQPFRNIDQLEPGDEIIVTTIAGRFVYRVTGTQIVGPSDYQVVATTRPEVAEITLVSCHPVFSAAQRIIVSGELDESQSSPVGRPIRYGLEPSELPGEAIPPVTTPPTTPPSTAAPTSPPTTDTSTTTTVPPTTVPDTTVPPTVPDDDQLAASVSDAFGRGWFHDRNAFGQIALWGGLLALVSIGSYLLSRRFRRDLVGFVVGVAPFAVAAFFFFQNVNRLLPPNL